MLVLMSVKSPAQFLLQDVTVIILALAFEVCMLCNFVMIPSLISLCEMKQVCEEFDVCRYFLCVV